MKPYAYNRRHRTSPSLSLPSWNKVDALAEKNPHLSPYVFAGGNPVNFGDWNENDPGFIEEVMFGLRHPDITLRIGIRIGSDTQDISSNSERFASTNGILNRSSPQGDKGSEAGAFVFLNLKTTKDISLTNCLLRTLNTNYVLIEKGDNSAFGILPILKFYLGK